MHSTSLGGDISTFIIIYQFTNISPRLGICYSKFVCLFSRHYFIVEKPLKLLRFMTYSFATQNNMPACMKKTLYMLAVCFLYFYVALDDIAATLMQ